jgi:hypothetical protein
LCYHIYTSIRVVIKKKKYSDIFSVDFQVFKANKKNGKSKAIIYHSLWFDPNGGQTQVKLNIYHTRREQANHYTTNAVQNKQFLLTIRQGDKTMKIQLSMLV